MLLFGLGVPNYGKAFNIPNQKICYIEGCVGHDEVGDYRQEWSDINVVISFRNHIMLKQVLDDTNIVHNAIH